MTKNVKYKKIIKDNAVEEYFSMLKICSKSMLYFLYYATLSEIKRRGLDV